MYSLIGLFVNTIPKNRMLSLLSFQNDIQSLIFPDGMLACLPGGMSRFPGGGGVTTISSESAIFGFIFFLTGGGDIFISSDKFAIWVNLMLTEISPTVLELPIVSSIR